MLINTQKNEDDNSTANNSLAKYVNVRFQHLAIHRMIK